jgi:hypothetical protein
MLTRFTNFTNRIRLSGIKLPFNLDIYSLIGSGAALLVLLLFYLLMIAPEKETVSTPAAIVGLLIALSPLFVAYRVERTTGAKIFCSFSDFAVAIAWVPLIILVLFMTENRVILLVALVCGLLIDPIWLGPHRMAYSEKTRIMMAYSRGLCGIIGTILVLTFIGKLMEIGDPKNKKTLLQEILGAVIWGYIGKKFFDFIGVTKPIELGSLFGTRKP